MTMDKALHEIIETTRDGRYTGNYRLIGVPGNYIELPGRGGRVTQQAAWRALACLEAGGTHAEAQEAAFGAAPVKKEKRDGRETAA